MTNCPECNKKLSARFEYCPHCGEVLNRHKFTFVQILQDFVKGFTHLDYKIVRYFKLLFTKPWFIIYEYLHGRKKRYFNPYVAFVIVAGILVFTLHNEINRTLEYKKKVIEENKISLTEKQYQQYQNDFIEQSKRFDKQLAINKYIHVLSLFIYALPFWICIYYFHNRQYNYIETVFAFMVLWTFVMIVYSLFTFVEMLAVKKGMNNIYLDQAITVLVSFFVSFNFLKLLQPKKRILWFMIFAGFFIAVDNYIMSQIILFIAQKI